MFITKKVTMDVSKIAKLGTAIEMRREVLKLAMNKDCTEDDIWKELEIYRKTHPDGQRKREPTHIQKILKNIMHESIILTESPIEDILRRELRARQIDFEAQKKIGRYRVDFFFPQADLIVEAEGKQYHSSPEQTQYDQKRQSILMKKGYLFLRFGGSEIYNDVVGCVDKIVSFLL